MALLSVGCLVGALMGGFISDLAGRKPTVILGAILVTGGGMLHTGAINLWLVNYCTVQWNLTNPNSLGPELAQTNEITIHIHVSAR